MTEQERMAIEHACSRLVVEFYVRNDDFDNAAIINQFTDDAVWDHIAAGRLSGKKAITDYLNSKNTSAVITHGATNILIDVIDKDHAKGKCYWTFYAGAPGVPAPVELKGVMAVGAYDDEFVRTDKGWKFKYRRTSIRFEAKHRSDYVIFKKDVAAPKT